MFRNIWGSIKKSPETKDGSALTTNKKVVDKKKWLKKAGLVCIPLITFGAGFGISHLTSQPKIVKLQNDVTTLTSSNEELNKLYADQTLEIEQRYIVLDKYIELNENYTALQNDYDDLSTELSTLKADKQKTEEKYQKLVHTIQTTDNNTFTLKYNDNDVRVLSGATSEQLNKILKDTWLEGYGEVFVKYEKEYGVNALFSIGNAILETGWDGDSYLARNKNNIYGISTSRVFESKTACIEYWFNLISKYYVGDGLYSIARINEKYCPPNARWSDDITWIVNKLSSKSGVTVN